MSYHIRGGFEGKMGGIFGLLFIKMTFWGPNKFISMYHVCNCLYINHQLQLMYVIVYTLIWKNTKPRTREKIK